MIAPLTPRMILQAAAAHYAAVARDLNLSKISRNFALTRKSEIETLLSRDAFAFTAGETNAPSDPA